MGPMTDMQYAFGSIQATMEKNIANSVLQIHFHQNATAEELKAYYGWEEQDFTDKDREGIIEDTKKRLEQEQFILRFYKKEEANLIQKYGKIEPTGDFGLAPKRTTGEGDKQGSVTEAPAGDGSTGPVTSA